MILHLNSRNPAFMNKCTAFVCLSLAVFTVIAAVSCKKEESGSLSNQEEMKAATAAATSETETEFSFNDVFDNVIGINSDLGIAGVGVFGKLFNQGQVDTSRCFNFTISSAVSGGFPKTVIIDFGSGCSTNSVGRSGKIKTVYTGRLTVPGSSATTSFENFKIDNITVEGTHKVTNITPAGALQRVLEVQVIDGKLSKPDGNYSIWNSLRQVKQLEGNLTETFQDDVFAISGTAKGKIKVDNLIFIWNSEIVEPLTKRFVCRWISKGKIRVLRETLPSNSPWQAVLDYGNGDCDNKAVVNVNGDVKQITLR